ncbi:cytochrome c oxidase accessory protein CcoG [Microbaculum marinisediminis]|uniref:Cytochrome c oxidase accessory protein CcoG n=1 Tax=Microbaculum marinisediminis TaxID=2931392 RepID=A0AAW5QTV2_9HYPH|nr:cytochrome c oxidase accessory protein CcoG [Microbaculum sp. A6E488]MCT8970642.1 cytochrome c oxidase accessory protein CcoG [Microbaculum sp. A6E488]
MRVDTGGGSGGTPTSLYAPRKKVYPQKVEGTFRSIKWAVMVLTLGVYYFTPFIRWDRGPNAPDQAVLIDFPGRRFYFFFIEIWPQEVYYITGLLILASMVLFLMNAVAGRLWCGYLCPQTVWTDLFYAVERLIEGDRRDRMKADKGGWTPTLVMEKVSKHALWLLIAWWTGGAWVLYFADAPTLVRELATFQASPMAYLWIGILTFTTYLLAGFAREQVCVYMCPWPRIQAALTDEWALNVTYKYDRGEPRMSVKQAEKAVAAGEPAGDCVDCYQCVAVCPTGIDIRDGLQLECIQCGLCIDACNTVMDKIGRPRGLIGYDTDINLQRREEGKGPIYRFFRARTVIYVAIIAAVAGIMAYTLATRSTLGISVLHDRNPVFVQLSEGGIRNGYTVRILNKYLEPTDYVLSLEGLPGATIEAVGTEKHQDGWPVITVEPDKSREVRVLVNSRPGETLAESTPITFWVTNPATGESEAMSDFFRAPK